MGSTPERASCRRRVALIGMGAVVLAAIVVPRMATAGSGAPIIITSGGTYSGTYVSSDPSRPAVLIDTDEPVVIDGAHVEATGTLIQVATGTRADVTIRNSYGEAHGGRTARFVVFDTGWRRAVVENNELVNTSGMLLHNARPSEVRIEGNRIRDVQAGPDDWFVQAVAFDKVVGPIDVGWNEIINHPDRSKVEDTITLYSSGGNPGAPARIHDNFIWGAFPRPVDAGGYSGGGIMIGDNGAAYGNTEVTGNQVVGTTNYGISIVCGTNQWVVGNTIVSSGRTSDGHWIPATNVGLSLGSSSRWGADCPTYVGNTAINNHVGWQRQGGRNDWWTPDCSVCSGNTAVDHEITYDDEKAEYATWRARTANRVIGRATSGTGAVPPSTAAPTSMSPVPTSPPPARRTHRFRRPTSRRSRGQPCAVDHPSCRRPRTSHLRPSRRLARRPGSLLGARAPA